jgi:hypothetical protein
VRKSVDQDRLLADRRTVRDRLRRVVTKVEIESNGGTLYLTLPRQSCILVPLRELLLYTCHIEYAEL